MSISLFEIPMTNSLQDAGTWTWTWIEGPLGGTSHNLISNKCELRPHDQLDGPIITLWQTPSGFVCQIAGGELEVNGAVSDIHLLKQGDLIRSPEFKASLQYVFAEQNNKSDSPEFCDTETMDACFLDPNEVQLESQSPMSEETSVARKKLLIAFRGLRKIKHKISSVPTQCSDRIINTIEDINARIDHASLLIEQLLSESASAESLFCGGESKDCIGECHTDKCPTDANEFRTEKDHFDECDTKETCIAFCCPEGNCERNEEALSIETPPSTEICDNSCADWQGAKAVEHQSTWLPQEAISNETSYFSVSEQPAAECAANDEPSTFEESTPITGSGTEELETGLSDESAEVQEGVFEQFEKFLYASSATSLTLPASPNPKVDLESVSHGIDADSRGTKNDQANANTIEADSSCPAISSANTIESIEAPDFIPLIREQPTSLTCGSESSDAQGNGSDANEGIEKSSVSENLLPELFESSNPSKFETPPYDNMTMVVGNIQELIEHAHRKAALRIAETQGISAEEAGEFTSSNDCAQEIADAVNSLDADDACTVPALENQAVDFESISTSQLVAAHELEVSAMPNESEEAAPVRIEFCSSSLTNENTKVVDEVKIDDTDVGTMGDVYADAAHVFVPLREMSATSQIRFHEVLNRLNAESVDMTEIVENKLAPSISDNELLGLNSFDLTVNENNLGDMQKISTNPPAEKGSDDLHLMTTEQWLNQQSNQPSSSDTDPATDADVLEPVPNLDVQINRNLEEIETELNNLDNIVEPPATTSADQRELSDPNALSDDTKSEIGSLRSRLRELLGTYSSEELAALPEAVAVASLDTDSTNPAPPQIDMNLQSEEHLMTTLHNSLTPDSNLASAEFLSHLGEPTAARPVAPPVPAPAQQPIEALAVRTHHHEDESVDDYMSKLFNRLRGTEPERHTPAKVAVAPVEHPEIAATPSEQPEATLEAPLKADEFLPKKQAPERQANMNVLRQLANESTRMAVTQFEVTQQKSMSSTRIACFGAATGFALVFFALSKHMGDLTSIAGMGSAALAAGVGIWHLVSMRDNSPVAVQAKTPDQPGK